MLRTFLISAAGAVIFSLAMSLVMRTRSRETDASGNPTLRYLAFPYVMPVLGVICLAVGISQWLDPINHRYSGNLLILSYIPTAIGVGCFFLAVHFWRYRVVLTPSRIEVYRWPLRTTEYKLSDLTSVEEKGQQSILRFSNNRKFIVYPGLSGRQHFLEKLSPNNSFKPKPLRGSA